LQCSEADAHLILADDNSAARLLSRPGEAIYNDANGRVEGNNPFQVVWLPEKRREDYLQQVLELDRQRYHGPTRAQIVFEGNAAADVAKNNLLHDLLAAPQWPVGQRAFPAWLGEAIAIKDPTAAVFRPQSGSNLLLVGQQEESALGILGMSVVSLAAQHVPGDDKNPAGARFYLLDGSPVDSPQHGILPRLANYLPHPVQVVTLRRDGRAFDLSSDLRPAALPRSPQG
jgi:S-DNA-T family DNA segregation ATPase FtsK/SpoIIIE